VIHKGDCLSCKKVSTCTGTSAERVYAGFTCQLFEGVPEPEYLARLEMIKQYGEPQAIRAILNRLTERGEDTDA
jgi:hypothetical protein